MSVLTDSRPKRGCGYRKDGGLYACVAMSPYGRPIEEFILDPAIPYDQPFFRGAKLEPRNQDGTGPVDVEMFIGKSAYPFFPDFIEEARVMGISKRIPPSTPFERLTPWESKLVLLHLRGIPESSFKAVGLPASEWCKHPQEKHECTFDLWGRSSLKSCKGHRVQVCDGTLEADVTIPCERVYRVPRPVDSDGNPTAYESAKLAAFYISHWEFVSRSVPAPKGLQRRIERRGWRMDVVED